MLYLVLTDPERIGEGRLGGLTEPVWHWAGTDLFPCSALEPFHLAPGEQQGLQEAVLLLS